MQMENIFKKIRITNYFFDSISISDDLFNYIFDNLKNENNNILRWDLRNTLTTNANGEYI
jgi:hypothetical protein